MEIIITIVVFWLILAAAYAVYYIYHERTRHTATAFIVRPESAVEHLTAVAFASGPFDMPERPTSISTAVPDFVSRAQKAARRSVSLNSSDQHEETKETPEKADDGDADVAPKIDVLRYVSQSESSPRTRGSIRRREVPKAKETPAIQETAIEELGSEVEMLRAQVQQLRSEVDGLVEARSETQEAPRQRRTRTAGTSQSTRGQRRQAN